MGQTMTSVAPYDHFRPEKEDYPDGIYRVVGTNEGTATLVQVADADSVRVNTGRIITVAYDELNDFELAENPDGNRPLRTRITSKFQMAYWSFRVFIQQLVAHPLPSAIALTTLLAGRFGEPILPIPDTGFGVLIIAGSLGLAYIGSGRLQRHRS